MFKFAFGTRCNVLSLFKRSSKDSFENIIKRLGFVRDVVEVARSAAEDHRTGWDAHALTELFVGSSSESSSSLIAPPG